MLKDYAVTIMMKLHKYAKRFGVGMIVWFAYGLLLIPTAAVEQALRPAMYRA